MDAAFESQASKREGEDLLDFLLDNAAEYWKFEQARQRCEANPCPVSADLAREECDRIYTEFKTKCDANGPVTVRKVERIDFETCDLCGHDDMQHLPSSASYVCLQCGYERVYGITDAYADNCLKIDEYRVLPYQYEANKYLQQHLDNMQGIRRRRFPKAVLTSVAQSVQRLKVSVNQITPGSMKDILKCAHLPSYYKHRWALARYFNSNYRPVTIPEETQQQLHALFQGCFVRFAEEFRKRGARRKNFVSYPMFIQRALCHLGVAELARDCECLKGVANQTLQVQVLDEILADLMLSRSRCVA